MRMIQRFLLGSRFGRCSADNNNLRKVVKLYGKNHRKARKTAMSSFFWDYVRRLETCAREGDQIDFYNNLKTANLEGKRDRGSAYVKDEDVVLLMDVELIRE